MTQTIDRMRVFLAIEIPHSIQMQFASVQRDLKSVLPSGKWVNPESIHLTVKFLGDVTLSKIERIKNSLPEWFAGIQVYEITPEQLGVFPHIRSARVLWIGGRTDIQKHNHLIAASESNFCRIGFPAETKTHTIHLTLARFRDRPDPEVIQKILEKYSHFGTVSFRVEKLVLFQSTLTQRGSIYNPLCSVRLQ